MIEEHSLIPRDLVVAVCTLHSHRTLVHVIIFVATETVRAGRCVEQRRHVTCAAFRTRVSAVECVTSVPCVLEPHFRPS